MITIIRNGEKIGFKSMSGSGSITAYSFSFSFNLNNYADYLKFETLTEIDYDFFGTIFRLIVEPEKNTRSWSGANESFKIQCRSKTALLDSLEISKTYSNTTAKNITQELCDSVGVNLIWQVIDWDILEYDVKNLKPISIIKKLVGSDGIGAILQSNFDGSLIVTYRDKISPAKYDVADNNITDIISFSESFDSREKYTWVSVGNESSIKTEKPTVSMTTEQDGEDILIKVFVAPFQTTILNHAGMNKIGAIYQGIHTETVSQKNVTIIDGKGNVSKNFYGDIVATWFYDDLGQLTITEKGKITSSIKSHSLLDLTYTTKYHIYRASGGDKTLAWVEAL